MPRTIDEICKAGARREIRLNEPNNWWKVPKPTLPATCEECGGKLERGHTGSFTAFRIHTAICVPCDVAWLRFEAPCI